MSLLNMLKGLLGSRHALTGSGGVYIVDAQGFAGNGGKSSRPAPRAQIDLLKRLSGFAAREKIAVHVVFTGKPLRDAPDKQQYEEIMVYYATEPKSLSALIAKLAGQLRRRGVVTVITSHKDIEDMILARGARVMRATTFRKALDMKESGNSDRRDGGRRRARRNPKRPKARKEPAPGKKNENGVNDLIDLI